MIASNQASSLTNLQEHQDNYIICISLVAEIVNMLNPNAYDTIEQNIQLSSQELYPTMIGLIPTLYLLEPYFWYVRTNTSANIMCDENIKSPQP